ncbi:hypothetical protein V8F06_013365 [Rhypophila decipiens]
MRFITVTIALFTTAVSAQACEVDPCIGKGGICIITPVTKVATCIDLKVCAPGLDCAKGEICYPTPNCESLGCTGICVPE